MAAAALPGPSPGFRARKREILDRLAVPTADYTDASPKGSVDEGIRHLIAEINGREGLVTTSSCAGRVSVFLEGRKKAPVAARVGSLSVGAKPDDEDHDDEEAEDEGEPARSTARLASAGGKGGGGSWLFVSHDPIDMSAQSPDDASSRWEALFGLGQSADGAELGDLGAGDSERLIHFKFEPMILHILAASNEHAQLVLRCALEAGFRESGALGIFEKRTADAEGPSPMVAVRSMGLLFESLVGIESGGKRECIVSPSYLEKLVGIANERFVENQSRIERFRSALSRVFDGQGVAETQWEPKELRLARKRAEGLRRQQEAREQKEQRRAGEPDEPDATAVLYEDLQ